MRDNKGDSGGSGGFVGSDDNLFDFDDIAVDADADAGVRGNPPSGVEPPKGGKGGKGGKGSGSQSQALTRLIYLTLLVLSGVVVVLLYLQYKTSKELSALSESSVISSQMQLLDSPPITSNIIFQAVKGVLMDLGGSNNDIVISKLDANQSPPVVWVDITLRGGVDGVSAGDDAPVADGSGVAPRVDEVELRRLFVTNLETLLLPTGVTISDKGFQIEVRGPEYTIIILLKGSGGESVPVSGGDIGEYSNITDEMLVHGTADPTIENVELNASYQHFAASLSSVGGDGVDKSLIFVIDDCGYSDALTSRVANIHRNLTIAVIPFLPYSASSAAIARSNGNPVFLHLPMEPYHDAPIMNDLSNRLMVNMTPDDWTRLAVISAEDLGGVGSIDGFNNHEGSYFTEGLDRMATVLQAMKPFSHLFLDSRTSSKSMAFAACEAVGDYGCASNNWYLDNNNDYDYIFSQTLKLADAVQRRGEMITIAHCRAKTVDALELAIPLLVERGYHIATVPAVATVPSDVATVPATAIIDGES